MGCAGGNFPPECPADFSAIRRYRHPWVILAITAVITVFLAIGLPRVKFDSDIKSMIPANNHSLMIRDYYSKDSNFASNSTDFIGVESSDAFSVESLKYLRTITGEIDKINQSLPIDNVAKHFKFSKDDASLVVEAARSLGLNDQTISSNFLPIIQDASKSVQTFSWDSKAAIRIASAVAGVDPLKLYHLIENPIKKTQSLVNADYIINKDDALVSDKLLPNDIAITHEVARNVKERAASWNIYENVLYSKDGTLANLVVETSNTDAEATQSIVPCLKNILTAHQVPGITTYLDGEGIISNAMGETMRSDLLKLTPRIILIVLVVLFFASEISSVLFIR